MAQQWTVDQTRRAVVRWLVIISIAALAAPAQTGQHAADSFANEIVSFDKLMAERGQVRRGAADTCLTEAGLQSELAGMGFQSVTLGANVATLDMAAHARFGTGWFALRIDRCNGRLLAAVAIVG